MCLFVYLFERLSLSPYYLSLSVIIFSACLSILFCLILFQSFCLFSRVNPSHAVLEVGRLGKPQKSFFSGPATKTLSPPSSLVATKKLFYGSPYDVQI